ncbi:40S ribosomal protein S21 [Bienertia sinuspersici]
MDLYIPRKCSATNRLITAKDHASASFVPRVMLTVLLIASGRRRKLKVVSKEGVTIIAPANIASSSRKDGKK